MEDAIHVFSPFTGARFSVCYYFGTTLFHGHADLFVFFNDRLGKHCHNDKHETTLFCACGLYSLMADGLMVDIHGIFGKGGALGVGSRGRYLGAYSLRER
jgi:hypothetical protein